MDRERDMTWRGKLTWKVAMPALVILTGAIILFLTGAMAQNPEKTQSDQGSFFKIATGSVAGTYFPIGEVLASIISHPAGAVRCEQEERCGPRGLIAVAQASAGSVRNAVMVETGFASSALAQADIVQMAYGGKGPFQGQGPLRNLRAIASLYPESIHVAVAVSSGIETIADLKGKRVSLDVPGSGTYANAVLVLEAAGLNERSIKTSFANVDQSAELIHAGELDAFFIVGGAPVNAIEGLAEDGAVRVLSLDRKLITKLRQDHPYLTENVIPAGTYRGSGEIRTLGVGALWIVSKDVDGDLVYRITRALWDPSNRPLLDTGHPRGRLIRLDSALDGIPIPLHEGAKRYYEEQNKLVGN